MTGRIPNLLWIVTTQWRAQAFGHMGDSNAKTPHLDALAATSLRFTEAVTPHPFGPFARAAMLTGLASPANGIEAYFDRLPIDARTVAHDLNERGYATSYFGKWHLSRRDPAAPLVGEVHARTAVPDVARGGFTFWEGFESGFLLNDPWLHGTRLPEPAQFEGYQSDVLCDRAAAFLAGATAPWFSIVSLEAPHPPYSAPAPGVKVQAPYSLALRKNVPALNKIVVDRARKELAGYYAHIEATDRAIGRLLASVPDSTIVVFTSVHGDMHGSHGLFRKGWPHEESVRVPLYIRLPGGVGAGESAAAVSLLDLPALTRRMTEGNFEIPSTEFARISMPSVVQLPFQCDRQWRGIRTPSDKLILGEDGVPWLYYDLKKDPFEMTNRVLESDVAGRIRELASL